jgi:hypothetical protein
MNNTYLYILSILGVISFTSCEDVIDLELDNTDPRVVIEAITDMNTSSIEVDVSLTTDFFDESVPNVVTDASVTLINEAGDQTIIPVNAEGSYSLSPIDIVSGEKYTLEVVVDGETYTAETFAPFQVDIFAIDTLLEPPFFEGGNPFFQCFYSWQDTPNEENHYQLRTFINDTLSGPLAIYDDDGLDGQLFIRPLMALVEFGDTVRFQLLSIDKETYDYFVEFNAAVSQGFNSTTPFNPQGNFDNDGLGYFGIRIYNEVSIQF